VVVWPLHVPYVERELLYFVVECLQRRQPTCFAIPFHRRYLPTACLRVAVCSKVGTEGMCSKCYRENKARQQQAETLAKAASEAGAVPAVELTPSIVPIVTPAIEPPVTSPSPAVLSPATLPVLEQPEAATPAPSIAAPSPESASKCPTRCQQCRKKVGLTGFKCKCGLLFCGQHRYAEAHACSFDYKTIARQQLAENNPLVQASKVQRL